jgi:hypothetical protein
MSVSDRPGFREMAAEFPVRTSIFTLVPLLFTLLQIMNYVHGASLLLTGGFALAVIVYTVLVHQYHLASFKRTKLSPEQIR